MKKIVCFLFILTFAWGCEKETAYKDIVEVEDEGISIAVNEAVILLDKNNTANITYSENTQTVTITGSTRKVEKNSVLVIDLDTAGVIRKVVSVKNVNNQTVCETEQATMEDVFGDAHFQLSTSMIKPMTPLKRVTRNSEISRAMTDREGFIHPVEVIYHKNDGTILRSRADDIEGQFGDNLYTYRDFNGKMLYQDNLTKFYISEGYAEFSPVFKFEFDYDNPNIDWNNLKIEKGKLTRFKFWTEETKFDFKTVLAFEIAKQIQLEEQKRLFSNVIKTSFKFMVGEVPVYISIDCDIYGKYNLNFSSQLEITTGFQATRYLTAGVEYKNGSWTDFHEYRKEDTFFPPELSANISFSQRLEVYPHFDVKLYKVLGPTLDIVPFIFSEQNADLSGDWNAHLDLGLDLRLGAEVEILGKNLLKYQTGNINLYTETVWKGSNKVSMIQWQKCLGGSADDFAHSIQQTGDGGYIVAGYTISNDGDISGNHGSEDCWIVKLNSSGSIQWQKCLGGSDDDEAYSVQQTSDGGYVVAGYARSNDGDVSGNHGGSDCWIVKLNSSGSIQWQKCLGGSDDDEAYSVQQTSDGGYIVAGYARSNDGDVSGYHGGGGYPDYWVVKLDATGTIQWQKCLGGSGEDEAYSIQQTGDGGYIVAGTTTSNDGDVSGNHGGGDCWVVKLNASGSIQWQKCLGGSDSDDAYSVQQTGDGGYIVAGSTDSNDGDVSGNHGDYYDCWVVKLGASGSIQWQKCLGGSDWDEAYSIQQTSDGGYIVAGITSSNDGDVSGNHGIWDCWIIKLNASGSIQWQKCLGGSRVDDAESIQQTGDGGYIVAGYTRSNDGDVSGNHGEWDCWVVKLSPDTK